MKNMIKAIIFTFLATVLISCGGESSEFQDKYAGTTPVIEVNGQALQAMVIYLNVSESNFDLNGTATPFTLIEENNETITFDTDLRISEQLSAKTITYSKKMETFTLELAETDRSIVLEKYKNMIDRKVKEFVEVELSSDISHLSDAQKEMLVKLFRVAEIMDEIYWQQTCPEKDQILAGLSDPNQIDFFMVNYGPWERLNGDLPFLSNTPLKAEGSGFYPVDMSKEEFEALEIEGKKSLYTLIERDEAGALKVVPYHLAYEKEIAEASALLDEAADLAEDEGFALYLKLRAKALLTDDYLASDMAWMEMKNNDIDFVVGPIENYEDKLYNYKAAHEAFILIKDKEWSNKLAYINSFLPSLQKNLPVPEAYKKEVPGSESDLGAYDVVYYAGDCNASSKTIAINLPNDERVQLEKGSRKLQLKNSIRYKFEQILVPISNVLIAEDQREYIKFDAFFENIMFHEIGHGLGLNNTINGEGTVRAALKEQYSALEEGKADILSLFLITQLTEMGELGEKELMDNYVTFMAGIFRSVRFGVASSHGKANMVRFYYFQEKGAFTRDEATGTYRIDFEKMKDAMNSLANEILVIQGDGNYEAAKKIIEEKGFIRVDLQKDLDRLEALNIPVDIRFKQGKDLLGL